MKIAFTARGNNLDAGIDPRFGRAEYLIFIDDETEKMEVADNTSIKNEAHGAGPKTAQLLLENKPDVLITGNGPGGNAASALERGKVKIYIGADQMTVKEAYEAYKDGKLAEF
jgi:predicted Fe-Mo cluster-binding NifX family protein